MLTRFVLAALLAFAVPVAAQVVPPAAPPPPAPVITAPLPHVEITTSAGKIVIRLESKRAPKSVANFLRYVDAKRYDGGEFYRSTQSWGPGAGLVQGGSSPKALRFPPVAHEPTSGSGLTHCVGALSMARGAPGSATSDFFVMLSPIADFDAKAAPGDPGFAVFGEVVAGMDVVQAIYASPVDPAKGDGAMKGQMITPPVKILTMRRTLPSVDLTNPPKSCFAAPK
ncbi:MAG: hypothetical protein RLZZ58_991 [Pseudomonadota bacterium]